MDAVETAKLLATLLVLPPVPGLVMMLVGARLGRSRPGSGRLLLWTGALLIWLGACAGSAGWLAQRLPYVAPLGQAEIAALKPPRAQGAPTTVILVLGGGRIARAPETGSAELNDFSLQRLLHGVRLARQTGLPLAFSGGLGRGEPDPAALSEAEIAQRVAERDFRLPLRWIESSSRDTRENAIYSVRLLRAEGVRHIVLVTHVWHMPRALRAFEQAAGDGLRITAAATGYIVNTGRRWVDWLPTTRGQADVRWLLRERLALAAGD
jgi:uncharacterized SAM-binding protein YcdF (DUF218 family)